MQRYALTAVMILAQPVAAAPVPVYRVGRLSLQQQLDLMRAAEEEIEAAERQWEQSRSKWPTGTEQEKARRVLRKRYRAVAVKLSSLHAESPGSSPVRLQAAAVAAATWYKAGNAAKALEYALEVASESPDGEERANAWLGAWRCHLKNQGGKAAEARARLVKEIACRPSTDVLALGQNATHD